MYSRISHIPHTPHTVDAYISLGSNSPDARVRLKAALTGIASLSQVRLSALSRWYWTQPQDFTQQPWFLNGVARVACGQVWSAPGLVRALLQIEASLGRRRCYDPARRCGPRPIDLDLLVFGTQRHYSRACTVPHPRMRARAFVCVPLRDVAPQGILPDGICLQAVLGCLHYRLDGDRIYQ